VRINNTTGTAEDGGLFYVENAPPECLFLSHTLFSDERRNTDHALKADELADKFSADVDGQLVQVGGDATYGRGQMVLTRVEA
jgi:CRISPR-associated protein Cmr4